MKDAIINITGRVFNDPTTIGNNVMKFSVGVYRGKNKETQKSESEFFDVVDWNNVHAGMFTPKSGDFVTVKGEFAVNRYKNKNGEDRMSLQVTPETIIQAPNPFDGKDKKPAPAVEETPSF